MANHYELATALARTNEVAVYKGYLNNERPSPVAPLHGTFPLKRTVPHYVEGLCCSWSRRAIASAAIAPHTTRGWGATHTSKVTLRPLL